MFYIKDSETLYIFKGKIWKWKPKIAPAASAKKYIYIYAKSRLHKSDLIQYIYL